jgi:tetratricopeptide (TPR) repeat protein
MGPFVSLGILQYQHFTDYDAALESLHRAIGREPGMGDGVNERVCYYHIGRIYQFGLDFDRARGALLKSVSLDQNYSAAWYELGRIQYEEALLAGGAVEVRRERLEAARETFMSGIMALTRYRRGLIVVDRTNLPFDNALPFSTRDHNRTLRELRIRILEELGRFRGRIGAISLILDEPKRVLQEYREATTEGSVTEELEKLVSVARVILQSRPGVSGEPVPTGGTEDDGEIDAGEGR